MKIKTFLFLCLFSCLCFESFAQNKKEDDDLLTEKEKSKEKHIDILTIQEVQIFEGANNSVVNVVGNNNSHIVNQIHDGGLDPNITNISQIGNNNGAEINQDGSGINSSLVQDGNNNQYKVDASGNSINSNVVQNGNNNELEHALNGQNLNYELIQDGNNNRLMHTDFGSQSGPPQIIQEGNNMNLRIEQR